MNRCDGGAGLQGIRSNPRQNTMSDKPKHSTTPAIYAALANLMRDTAEAVGYMLSIHGSMRRDLDVIAVPWVVEAKSPEELIEALRASVGGYILEDGTPAARYNAESGKFVAAEVKNPEVKPHGRLAWSIQLGGGSYIDVSIMPRQPIKEVGGS